MERTAGENGRGGDREQVREWERKGERGGTDNRSEWERKWGGGGQ